MDEFCLKLIEQIKDFFNFFYENPLHTIIIGITLILIHIYFYNSVKIIVIGTLIVAFAIGTLIEIGYNKIKLRKRIISYYNELPEHEKQIVDYCIENKTVVYRTDLYSSKDYTDAIYSLVGKGFGRNISYGGDFILYNEVYKIIKSIKRKK